MHIVPPAPQLELWPPIAPHLASARTAPVKLGSFYEPRAVGYVLIDCISSRP